MSSPVECAKSGGNLLAFNCTNVFHSLLFFFSLPPDDVQSEKAEPRPMILILHTIQDNPVSLALIDPI